MATWPSRKHTGLYVRNSDSMPATSGSLCASPFSFLISDVRLSGPPRVVANVTWEGMQKVCKLQSAVQWGLLGWRW